MARVQRSGVHLRGVPKPEPIDVVREYAPFDAFMRQHARVALLACEVGECAVDRGIDRLEEAGGGVVGRLTCQG